MKTLIIAALAASLASTSMAEIQIHNAYARSGVPGARTGGAYMEIHNTGPYDDRLIGVSTDIAQMNQLHNNLIVDGIAQMVEAEGGIAIAAGQTHMLERGGDHVMMMGLASALEQGDMLDITLIFEQAGEVVLQIPVDYTRVEGEAGSGGLINLDHSGMEHSVEEPVETPTETPAEVPAEVPAESGTEEPAEPALPSAN